MRSAKSAARKLARSNRDAGAGGAEVEWSERAARLYTDLERPARAMVRRAFRGAFADDELDDIYAAAWVGSLRTLSRRHRELSDEQVRKYLLAAVANHASKELRRRKRRPTAPLGIADAVPDDGGHPDERAEGAERTRVVRDLLTSLPPRRRAVILLRYGWGLEPRQVCELVGISPRAYRREITRGVDALSEGMRQVERGEWCAERNAVLNAYANGQADSEGDRQARAHLAHCRACGEFVAALRERLHDVGASAVLPALFFELANGSFVATGVEALLGRAREAAYALTPRGSDRLHESVSGIAAGGGSRGAAGATGAGLLAKLGELGAAGKVAAACLASGAAVTACVGTGAVAGWGPVGIAAEGGQVAPARAGADRGGAVVVSTELATEHGPVPANEVDADSVVAEPVGPGAPSDPAGSHDAQMNVAPADREFSQTAATPRPRGRSSTSAIGSPSTSSVGDGHASQEFGSDGGAGAMGGAGSGAGAGRVSSGAGGEFGGP